MHMMGKQPHPAAAERRPGQKYVLDEEGRRLIEEQYDSRPETIDRLMRYFEPRGIPRYTVHRWARKLGKTRLDWSREELTYLRNWLGQKSIGAIAKHLHRSKESVMAQAKRLGISKTSEGYTMAALCQGLGCSETQIKTWLASGWLKGCRRQTERTPAQGDLWYFTDGAVRRLVKDHPLAVDLRRVDQLWFLDVLLGGEHGLGELAHMREENDEDDEQEEEVSA